MKALDSFIFVSLFVAGLGIVLVAVGTAMQRAKVPAPAPSALTAEGWTPCEPPRPGAECWRSGHAVVCLPVEEVTP